MLTSPGVTSFMGGTSAWALAVRDGLTAGAALAGNTWPEANVGVPGDILRDIWPGFFERSNETSLPTAYVMLDCTLGWEGETATKHVCEATGGV